MILPPRVILHVGTEKTASTSLQNFLMTHRAALLDQGFLFPQSVFTRKIAGEPERTSGHLELMRNLAVGDISAFAAEMAADGPRAHTLILSAENLFHYEPAEHLPLLARLLAGCEVTLVVVLRDQTEWILSYYNESVANGWNTETRTIGRFVTDAIAAGKVDYAGLLDRMVGAIRPAQVRLFNYATLRREGTALSAFCDLAGIRLPPEVFVRQGRSHVTRTWPDLLEAMRRMNPLAAGFWGAQTHEWSAMMRARGAALADRAGLAPGHLLPAPDIRQALVDHVRAGNAALSAAHLPDDPLIAAEDWARQPAPRPDEGRVAELVQGGLADYLDLRERVGTMRARLQGPRRWPVALPGDQTAMQHLASLLDQGPRVVLCQGAGGGAVLAGLQAGRMVHVLEADPAWAMSFQAASDRGAPASPLLVWPHRPGEAAARLEALAAAPWFQPPDLAVLQGPEAGAVLAVLARHFPRPLTVLALPGTRLGALPLVRVAGTAVEYRLDPAAGAVLS